MASAAVVVIANGRTAISGRMCPKLELDSCTLLAGTETALWLFVMVRSRVAALWLTVCVYCQHGCALVILSRAKSRGSLSV
jgi:hypothetical protein